MEKAENDRGSRREDVLQIPIEKTCILDCLDIVKQEYQIERGKRQSFESRANIVITILTALLVFVFEKIKIIEVLKLMTTVPCSFLQILKIISGIGVYVGFVVALVYAIQTISIRKCENFNINAINESLLGTVRMEGTIILVKTYRGIIDAHRKINDKIANALRISYLCVCITMITIVLYINL